GYWFTTDQYKGDNTVHIFERKSLDYVTSFKTKVTQNTDGVWITQLPVGQYQKGQFIMVNDDGGVSTFSLSGLFETLNISCN
ncbi:MAG: phytase precursor, partial [Candidatus Kapaibacterium sp.]